MAQIHSIARLKQLVRNYYKATGSGTNEEHELKGRANGFVEALLLTTRLTKKQIDEIIEKEHLDFFGMTREAYSHSADKSRTQQVEMDWEKFNEPAYRRRPLRCRKKNRSERLKSG